MKKYEVIVVALAMVIVVTRGSAQEHMMHGQMQAHDMGGKKMEMHHMQGKPLTDVTKDGIRVQVWVLSQDEHEKMMKHSANDPAMKEQMHHEMMNDEKMPATEHAHSNAQMDHSDMDAMMSGTHHVMVVLTDVKSSKEITDANVEFRLMSSEKTLASLKFIRMTNHYGGSVTMKQKGDYGMKVLISRGKRVTPVDLTFTVK